VQLECAGQATDRATAFTSERKSLRPTLYTVHGTLGRWGLLPLPASVCTPNKPSGRMHSSFLVPSPPPTDRPRSSCRLDTRALDLSPLLHLQPRAGRVVVVFSLQQQHPRLCCHHLRKPPQRHTRQTPRHPQPHRFHHPDLGRAPPTQSPFAPLPTRHTPAGCITGALPLSSAASGTPCRSSTSCRSRSTVRTPRAQCSWRTAARPAPPPVLRGSPSGI
jgi:hypothetical protein